MSEFAKQLREAIEDNDSVLLGHGEAGAILALIEAAERCRQYHDGNEGRLSWPGYREHERSGPTGCPICDLGFALDWLNRPSSTAPSKEAENGRLNNNKEKNS